MSVKGISTERIRILRRTLTQLFELQIHAGSSPRELASLARECVTEARRGARARAQSRASQFDAQDYGSVLKTWHRQGQYLSKDGFPRPLAIEGKFGLRSLIGTYYPKARFQQILKSLRDAGLIREQEDGKWTPESRNAVFPNLNEELLAHLAEGVSYLIDTVARNVASPYKDNALFERSAKVRSLPVSEEREFRRYVRSQGTAFLAAVDDWLESRAVSTSARGPEKCTAGVFAFAFLEDGKGESNPRKARVR